MFFFLLQTFRAKQRRQHREALSPLPSFPASSFLLGHLDCSPSIVATAGENRKPQLCGTKQACIMFTQ